MNQVPCDCEHLSRVHFRRQSWLSLPDVQDWAAQLHSSSASELRHSSAQRPLPADSFLPADTMAWRTREEAAQPSFQPDQLGGGGAPTLSSGVAKCSGGRAQRDTPRRCRCDETQDAGGGTWWRKVSTEAAACVADGTCQPLLHPALLLQAAHGGVRPPHPDLCQRGASWLPARVALQGAQPAAQLLPGGCAQHGRPPGAGPPRGGASTSRR